MNPTKLYERDSTQWIGHVAILFVSIVQLKLKHGQTRTNVTLYDMTTHKSVAGVVEESSI